MKKTSLNFVKNEEGKYQVDIVLPGRVNIYAQMSTQSSIKAFAIVDGIELPVVVGTSEYTLTPVLDINLIAGTTIRLKASNEVVAAVMISEEDPNDEE